MSAVNPTSAAREKASNKFETVMEITAADQTPFHEKVSAALAALRLRLERQYQRAYPDLGEIIGLVLDQEEERAWRLSPFPHLLLPDLVEAHIERLHLQSSSSDDCYEAIPDCEFAFA